MKICIPIGAEKIGEKTLRKILKIFFLQNQMFNVYI